MIFHEQMKHSPQTSLKNIQTIVTFWKFQGITTRNPTGILTIFLFGIPTSNVNLIWFKWLNKGIQCGFLPVAGQFQQLCAPVNKRAHAVFLCKSLFKKQQQLNNELWRKCGISAAMFSRKEVFMQISVGKGHFAETKTPFTLHLAEDWTPHPLSPLPL